MAPQQVPWGTITLILDNEAFRKDFLAAREGYFQDIYGEDGCPPEEPQHAVQLTSEEVLHLIVQPDEQGHSHFDEMGIEYLPEYLGYLAGYLESRLPLTRQSITAKSKPNKNMFVGRSQFNRKRGTGPLPVPL